MCHACSAGQACFHKQLFPVIVRETFCSENLPPGETSIALDSREVTFCHLPILPSSLSTFSPLA